MTFKIYLYIMNIVYNENFVKKIICNNFQRKMKIMNYHYSLLISNTYINN